MASAKAQVKQDSWTEPVADPPLDGMEMKTGMAEATCSRLPGLPSLTMGPFWPSVWIWTESAKLKMPSSVSSAKSCSTNLLVALLTYFQ